MNADEQRERDRFELTKAAIQGLLANSNTRNQEDIVSAITASVATADATLAELAKEKTK